MSTQRDHAFLQSLARRFAKPVTVSVTIVDPDLESAQRLAGVLRPACTVQAFRSAREAAATFEGHGPTLLVTELDLPDMSGFDLLRWARTNPNLRHMLLMVITSRRSVTDKIAALQAGADDYLVKPLESRSFGEHVERLSRFRQVIIPEE
jgi:DNA-binding response OmpR family regulator